MTQPPTPSRDNGGPASRPGSSRRGGRRGPSTTSSTPTSNSRRTLRTPRRASGASAPSTSARSRVQPAEIDDSRETSPIFTPRARARPDRQSEHVRAPSPARSFRSESSDEEFPHAMLDSEPGSQRVTEVEAKGWISPQKLEKERVERAKRDEARKKRKEWKKRRELEGRPRHKNSAVLVDDAQVIEISSDDELPSPRKRKRPEKPDSPRKKARAASVINISSGDEKDSSAPCPSTPPLVSDVDDVRMTGDDINVDGLADMALNDPAVPLDQSAFGDEPADPPEDITIMDMTHGIDEPLVSSGMAESTATEFADLGEKPEIANGGMSEEFRGMAELVATPNAFDELPWTASQMEDARVFDEALASVARELEDTIGSTSVSGNAPSPLPTHSPALRGPGVPSSPLPASLSAPPSPVVASPPTSDPMLPPTSSTAPTLPPLPPQFSLSSRYPLHDSLQGSTLRAPFRGSYFDGTRFISGKPCYQVYVIGKRQRTVCARRRDPEPAAEAEMPRKVTKANVCSASDREREESTPRCDPEKIAPTTCEPSSTRRDVSVPMRDLEPEPATMDVPGTYDESVAQDTSAPMRDSDSQERAQVAIITAEACAGSSIGRDVSVPMRDFESEPTSMVVPRTYDESIVPEGTARDSESQPGLELTQGATATATANPLEQFSTGRDVSVLELREVQSSSQDDSAPMCDELEPARLPIDSHHSAGQDDSPLRNPEPEPKLKPATADGYSPPPVSPTSDSTLGGTPPMVGTNVILPLALVAADVSLMKQVDFVLNEETDDDDDELEYPSP